MSLIKFKDVKISGLSAAVPSTKIDNFTFTDLFTAAELENAIKTTGIKERRFAGDGVCSSDLCFEAAQKLIMDLGVDRSTIDMVIFISQTPDFRQPATAPILQDRLGLPKSTACFDINLACSGYLYGLSTAFSYASQEGVDRVILLVGETLSKIVSPKDRATSLLFGDAGTATLIDKDKNATPIYMSLNSDGSGEGVLKIAGGGYRNKSSCETLAENEFEDGSIRSLEHLFMDGMEVFNFTMREVPKDIKKVLAFAGQDIGDIEYIVFHQANKFMTDFFAKKLKFPKENIPYSLQKFGNTSAVSIPLTIVSELKRLIGSGKKKILLSGFGGGLSWGSAYIEFENVHLSEIVEL